MSEDSAISGHAFTIQQASDRAEECRALAQGMTNKSHVIMLMHMYATWGRIAEDMERTHATAVAVQNSR